MSKKKLTRWQRAGQVEENDVEAITIYDFHGEPIRVTRWIQFVRFLKGKK